jgi:hypothetical protein
MLNGAMILDQLFGNPEVQFEAEFAGTFGDLISSRGGKEPIGNLTALFPG